MVLAVSLMIVSETDSAVAASSELSDEPIPLKNIEQLPKRTPPLIEIGPDFLGTGNIPRGIELPTGAVWTPALWVFGDYRTSMNYFNNGNDDDISEWVNRLDLFVNLQLTGTERLLLGVSPLHRRNEFSGYFWESEENDGWASEVNRHVTALFFEGEFGEIFPNLDINDRGTLDVGFSIGRQAMFFQEGIMFDDTIDAFALTRDTFMIPDLSPDTRITAMFGWNEVHRNDNREDKSAYVFGLFTETDFFTSTTSFDFAYIKADDGDNEGGDGLYIGGGAVQRFGHWNTDFRVNMSLALDDESEAVSDGVLLFTEISRTLPKSDDVVYGNFFWGIDEYASASRDDTVGGPLGRIGLLFAAVGLGNYGSALSNRADHVAGGSVGYQKFFDSHRGQIVLEAGVRKGTDNDVDDAAAVGFRLQQALGPRYIIRLDGFLSTQENADEGAGIRSEFAVQF